MRLEVWLSDRLAAQCNHADEHQVCLAHLIRHAQYAIDAGDAVFAPPFKDFLERACEIGGRRPNLADSTIKQYACKLERELDRLLELEPTNAEGRHLRDAIIVDARDKLLVFMRHRDSIRPRFRNVPWRGAASSQATRAIPRLFPNHGRYSGLPIKIM